MKHLSLTNEDASLDRASFLLNHDLADHPSLSLEAIARYLPELPPRCVDHSKGLSDLAVNFDRSFKEHRNGLSAQETIARLKEVKSYITVMDPQEHPAFRDLYHDLKKDVEAIQGLARFPAEVFEGRMWIFIASPDAITPFHFDRYSNFLLQIRGSKQMAIFPNFREEIVPMRACEAYMDREPSRELWKDELDRYAVKYDFRPGHGLHIPFAAGHYVKNGPGDISISLSFFFQTRQTRRWVSAMQFNNRVYRRTGLQLGPVGRSVWRDSLKAAGLSGLARVKSALRRPAGK